MGKVAKNGRKVKAYLLKMEKVAKNGRKVKAIALTFRPFLATFSIFHIWAKNSKSKDFFTVFSPLMKNGKSR